MNLNIRKRRGLNGSFMDDVKSTLTSAARQIAGDKDVKSGLVASAVEGVTGIAPTIDKSNPQVTVVRLRPEHGEFVDALLFKRKPSAGQRPSIIRGIPDNVRIDVMPAASVVVWRRVVPVAALLVGAGYILARSLHRR